jgi:hypothetical protein
VFSLRHAEQFSIRSHHCTISIACSEQFSEAGVDAANGIPLGCYAALDLWLLGCVAGG